MAKRKMTKY